MPEPRKVYSRNLRMFLICILFISKYKIWFIIKEMDPWIHGSAAGAAARAAAGAAAGAAGAAASAATICTCYVILGGALEILRTPQYLHDKVHTVAAEAAAPAAAPAAALAAAPAADPWIHGSISFFIMNHKPKKSKIFKRPKNCEDSSKLDDF